MKIFYKKDYELLKADYIALVERFDRNIKGYEETLDMQSKQLRNYEDDIIVLNTRINELKSILRKNNSAKGGFTTKINNLTKENEELKKKLEESMSDKYLVKKLRPQRTPKTQKMHLTGNAKTSSIIKKVFE